MTRSRRHPRSMPSPLGKGKGKASASVTPFAPAAPLVPPTSARTTKKPKPGKAAADKYRVADDTLTDLKEEAKQTVSPLPTGGGRRKSTMEQNFADASMIYSRRGGLSSRANRRSSTFNINIGATGVMGPPTVARRRTKTARRPAVHSGAGGTAGGPSSTEVEKLLENKPMDAETITTITAALLVNPLFASLPGDLIKKILSTMQRRDLVADEAVIEQGTPGFCFYVVLRGKYEAWLKGVKHAVAHYKGGSTFGELALLYNSPRAATIRCVEAGTVWALGGSAFRTLVADHNLNQKHGLEQALASAELFKGLEPTQLTRLANAMDTVEYSEADYIISKGDQADAMYLILSGEVVCHLSSGEQELMRLEAGQTFGESAIEKGKSHTGSDGLLQRSRPPERLANVVAVTNVRLARLFARDFFKILGFLSDIVAANFRKKVLQSVRASRMAG